jgi:hypothetical protein
MMNFGNSLKNSPTYTTLTTSGFNWGSDPGCTLDPFVYGDTLYAVLNDFNAQGHYLLKLMPLAGTTKYYDGSINHTFTAPGTYTVNLLSDPGSLNGNGGAWCQQIVVSAGGINKPDPYTVAKTTVCQNETNVTYTVPPVSGATAYEWSYSGSGATFSGGSSTSQPTNTVTFSGSATNGLMRVRATDGNDRSAFRDTAVSVGSIPAQPGAFSAGSQTPCQGQTTLTYTVPAVSGATSYEWSYSGGTGVTFAGGSSTATPTNTVNISGSATSGSIQVSAKNLCGTSAARSLAITIGSTPSQPGNFTQSSADICQGQLNVTYTTPATSGATSYEWVYTGSGASFSGGTSTAAPTNNIDFSGSATGGSLEVSARNSCGVSPARSLTVNVHTPPTATLSHTGMISICENDSILLMAGTGTGYSYQWKRDGIPTGTGGNDYAAYLTGSYKVVVTGPGSCKDSTQEVQITVYPRPSGVLAPGDTAFCDGGKITLQVSTADTGLGYRWKNGAATIPLATADFLEVATTGAYTVVLTRSHFTGCSDSTPAVLITVHPLPVPVITWDGLEVRTDTGHVSYQWYAGSQAIAGATAAAWQPGTNGSYTVTVTDSNGCTGTSQAYNVTNVGVPQAGALSSGIRIYPNPASGRVYVDADFPVYITVLTLEGREVIQPHPGPFADLGNLASGMYLLQVRDASGTLIRTEKLVKNHGL